MGLQAILVETNWVVDIVAPAHLQGTQAKKLLDRADQGEFELFIPAICLTEARETIPRRFAPRTRAEDLRKFVRWAKDQGRVEDEDASVAFSVFDKFETLVANELSKVPQNLLELSSSHSGLKTFPLSQSMLERQVEIGAMDIRLKPYDLAILAALLVKAEELQENGYDLLGFCELDFDLLPWDKRGTKKSMLADLYSDSGIEVHNSFDLVTEDQAN